VRRDTSGCSASNSDTVNPLSDLEILFCSCDLVVKQEVPGALMAQIWRNNTNRAIFHGAIIFLKETVTLANRPALVFEPNSDYYSNQSMSRI